MQAWGDGMEVWWFVERQSDRTNCNLIWVQCYVQDSAYESDKVLLQKFNLLGHNYMCATQSGEGVKALTSINQMYAILMSSFELHTTGINCIRQCQSDSIYINMFRQDSHWESEALEWISWVEKGQEMRVGKGLWLLVCTVRYQSQVWGCRAKDC